MCDKKEQPGSLLSNLPSFGAGQSPNVDTLSRSAIFLFSRVGALYLSTCAPFSDAGALFPSIFAPSPSTNALFLNIDILFLSVRPSLDIGTLSFVLSLCTPVLSLAYSSLLSISSSPSLIPRSASIWHTLFFDLGHLLYFLFAPINVLLM